MKNKKFILGAILRIAVVIAILTTVILKYNTLTHLDVRALIASTGSLWLSAALVVGVYALKSVLFVIPASMIYLSAGLAFDFLPGMAVNAAGLAAELILTYFLGRFLGGAAVEKKLSATKYGSKILKLQDEKAGGIFVVRLLPVFPIDFVSLFFGATHMPFHKYFAVSFFGILPRIILFTLLGDKFYEFFPRELLMTAVILIITFAAIFSTVRYFLKHRKNSRKNEKPDFSDEKNN